MTPSNLFGGCLTPGHFVQVGIARQFGRAFGMYTEPPGTLAGKLATIVAIAKRDGGKPV
ncbi:unnamed protein product, partial [marine sediment metagenome]